MNLKDRILKGMVRRLPLPDKEHPTWCSWKEKIRELYIWNEKQIEEFKESLKIEKDEENINYFNWKLDEKKLLRKQMKKVFGETFFIKN